MINYDVPLNARGINANIRPNVLDDKTMIANGFRRLKTGAWYLAENLGQEISLNIKVSQSNITIDVLDDDWGQPYDYQRIIRDNPEAEIALDVHRKVQATMKRLGDIGIIEGYVVDDYI